ncbi:sulfurtransferase [Inhella sp.]|uniref:sulfurtransferase n=1 Tax=Inhella sp. TaxID=1921806 RepID=UPI0035B100AD
MNPHIQDGRPRALQALRAALAILFLLLLRPALALELPGPLVSVEWLQQQLGREDLRLLDASLPPQHAAGHVPGAVSVNLYGYAIHERSPAQMVELLRSWGLNPGQRIVVMDQGGDSMAPRVYYDLLRLGVPQQQLAILDGGLARWKALGGALTQDATPAPAPGRLELGPLREELRVRLPEFLAASADPQRHALVEALEPEYHYGGRRFFDRAGHVPNAILAPSEDFFNADKTFKSPAEIRRMALHLGIRPEQQVHAHCGGGVAAAVPFFALRMLAGYPDVRLFQESQLAWLRDERQLPFWTYGRPQLLREADWLAGWDAPLLRRMGVTRIAVLDVREPAAFALGHLPHAQNLPAGWIERHLHDPQALAARLGQQGVRPEDEAVIVGDGGINEATALSLLALEQLGQRQVALLRQSVDEWGLRGQSLSRETLAAQPVAYAPRTRGGPLLRQPGQGQGLYPRLYLVSGAERPTGLPAGELRQLPYGELLQADGAPKPAHEIWALLKKAGVSRYAEVVCVGSRPGEAAVNYLLLRLMGFSDVKVLLP